MEEYFKNLPKKWMGAGALFFDNDGKFLIVKPEYKEYWEIPGGNIDEDESPLQAVQREVLEELALDAISFTLLSIDYHPNTDDRGDRLHFVFDGGVLTAEQTRGIRLLDEELTGYRFVAMEEALMLLGESLHDRIRIALKARANSRIMYLEQT